MLTLLFRSLERSVRMLGRVVQIHGVLEATPSVQIPHCLVVSFRHHGRHLVRLRVCVVEHVRRVVRSRGGVKHLGNHDDLEVVQLGVDEMGVHFDERRHLDAAVETDVGDVLEFGTKVAVGGYDLVMRDFVSILLIDNHLN